MKIKRDRMGSGLFFMVERDNVYLYYGSLFYFECGALGCKTDTLVGTVLSRPKYI